MKAVLVAVVLFALSFTFSSCKNCNGNKGKDDGKDNGGNNSVADRDKGDPTTEDKNKELTLPQIVEKAAGYACTARVGPVGKSCKDIYQEMVTARESLEGLMKIPRVVEAGNSRDIHSKAIRLLLVKARREEKLAEYCCCWAFHIHNRSGDVENRKKANMAARKAWLEAQEEANKEAAGALRMAQDAFVKMFTEQCKGEDYARCKGEDYAIRAFLT
jgi:hypothetical protein